jgi:hypothetical protein
VKAAMKSVNIQELLTLEEIEKAADLYAKCAADDQSPPFSVLCARDIIEPVIDRINQALGQENDPKYLAYCVEYVMTKLFEHDAMH